MPRNPADHAGDAADPATEEASSGVAVLDRAFAILRAFGQTDDRLSLAELSRRTGLYKSTILRLLAALEHGGFMRKLDDGQYAVGHEPLRLAALYQRSFRVGPVVEPLLETLSRELGETASFYVRQGDVRSVLYRVEPARAVRVSIRVGEEFPVGQGASGKVLLAFTDTHDARWNDVREQLWAASYGERDPETASASVAVFGAAGECVGALTVSGPKSRLAPAPAMTAALAMLLPLAQKATVALGGAGARYDAPAVRDSLARLASSTDDAARS